MVCMSLWYSILLPTTSFFPLFVSVFVCESLLPAGQLRQHPGHRTWCWPSRLYMTAQTVTSTPGRMRHINQCQAVNQFGRARVSPRRVCAWACVCCVCVRETNLSQVIKVVFPSGPAVSSLQTLCFIGDVTHIEPVAVEELSFEQLHTQTDASTQLQKHTRTLLPQGNVNKASRSERRFM